MKIIIYLMYLLKVKRQYHIFLSDQWIPFKRRRYSFTVIIWYLSSLVSWTENYNVLKHFLYRIVYFSGDIKNYSLKSNWFLVHELLGYRTWSIRFTYGDPIDLVRKAKSWNFQNRLIWFCIRLNNSKKYIRFLA